MRNSFYSYLIFSLTILCVGCSTQKKSAVSDGVDLDSAEQAVYQLRSLHFEQNYRLATQRGSTFTETFPNSVQLEAWLLINRAKSGASSTALRQAKKLLEEHPQDSWSYFALALVHKAHGNNRTASDRAAQAFSKHSQHPDFLWMRAATMLNDNSAITFADSVQQNGEVPTALLIEKGKRLAALSDPQKDSFANDYFQRARDIFKKVQDRNPQYFGAWYWPAHYLNTKGQPTRAYPLYKESVRLTTALAPHAEYWRFVIEADKQAIPQKGQVLDRDIDWLKQQRTITPDMLFSIATTIGSWV